MSSSTFSLIFRLSIDIYTITLDGTRILVQGQVYVPVEKPSILMPEPDREKDIFDWAIRAPAQSAQALIDSGGTIEEARQLMAEFYQQFVVNDTFSAIFMDDGYRLIYRGMEIYVPVPCQKREPKPDYLENTLMTVYKDLCCHLQTGDLILKGIGYQQVIKAAELTPQFLQRLNNISSQTVMNPSGDYKSVALPGGTCLLPSAIGDLVKANESGK